MVLIVCGSLFCANVKRVGKLLFLRVMFCEGTLIGLGRWFVFRWLFLTVLLVPALQSLASLFCGRFLCFSRFSCFFFFNVFLFFDVSLIFRCMLLFYVLFFRCMLLFCMLLLDIPHLVLRCLFCRLKRGRRVGFGFGSILLFPCELCGFCVSFKICARAFFCVCHLVCCSVSLLCTVKSVELWVPVSKKQEQAKQKRNKMQSVKKREKKRSRCGFLKTFWGSVTASFVASTTLQTKKPFFWMSLIVLLVVIS